MGIGEYFAEFCGNLRISQVKRSSIAQRTARITSRLNKDFRDLDSESAHSFYVGSYGRTTAIPSVSDIDLLYSLPANLYTKYNSYATNGQSALLAAVRSSLISSYRSSKVSGDGQVVVISFDDGITYEIPPAFLNTNDGYTFPDANVGGSWKACKPKQEMEAFQTRDAACNTNLVPLGRMGRAWRDANSVPMSGMLIDTLAYQFIIDWPFRDKGYFYYDWLSRDFFAYLAQQVAAKTYWLAPGSGSWVFRAGPFEYKARQAELRCIEAIEHQRNGREWSAKQKYREIYGTQFPT